MHGCASSLAALVELLPTSHKLVLCGDAQGRTCERSLALGPTCVGFAGLGAAANLGAEFNAN